jgi:hypothetical protein
MGIGETMNELLQFIMRHFSFLYDELGARFVDSQVHGINALLVFELPDVRVRFVRDRDQILMEFQHNRRPPSNEWFSFDVVQQLITGTIHDDAVMDRSKAEFVKAKFAEIADAFSKARHRATEKTMHEYEEARANRLFGGN